MVSSIMKFIMYEICGVVTVPRKCHHPISYTCFASIKKTEVANILLYEGDVAGAEGPGVMDHERLVPITKVLRHVKHLRHIHRGPVVLETVNDPVPGNVSDLWEVSSGHAAPNRSPHQPLNLLKLRCLKIFLLCSAVLFTKQLSDEEVGGDSIGRGRTRGSWIEHHVASTRQKMIEAFVLQIHRRRQQIVSNRCSGSP